MEIRLLSLSHVSRLNHFLFELYTPLIIYLLYYSTFILDKDHVVIFLLGIGVNVNSDVRRNPSLRKLATSVRTELGGRVVSREELLANICNYLEVCVHMDRADLLKEMTSYQLFLPGSAVKALDSVDYREMYTGVLTELRHNWTCVIKGTQVYNFNSTVSLINVYHLNPLSVKNGQND